MAKLILLGLFTVAAFAAGIAKPDAARAAPEQCRDLTVGSGSQSQVVRMCQGADGRWHEAAPSSSGGRYDPEPAVASTAANPDAKAEVEYRGTFDETITVPSSQGTNLRNPLGSVLSNALSSKTERHEGAFTITATLDGAASTAVFAGTGLQTIKTSGTRNNGYCRFFGQTELGYTISYEGRCSPQGFSGTFAATGRTGARLQGRFETSATKYVDVAERERQQVAARAEAERQAATARAIAEREERTAAAELAAKPNAPIGLVGLLENSVKQDSAAWIYNRYKFGSVRNVKIIKSKPNMLLHGEFSYINGMDGWVEAEIVRGNVVCLTYWDSIGCNPLRSAPAKNDRSTSLVNLKSANNCLVFNSFANGKRERNDAIFYGTTNYEQKWGRSITNRCSYPVSFELSEGGWFGPSSQTLNPGESIDCDDQDRCGVGRITRDK